MNYYSAIFINMTQLNKIIKSVLAEQITLSNVGLAKKIYNAKGLVWDNEYAALKAILAIKDSKQFNSVQKELQKLTGGRGIAQYVSEFIQVRDSMNAEHTPTTIRYIKSIIAHLTKIGTYKQTINIFDEKLKRITNWSKVNANLAADGVGQTQFAWETFADRAAVDPEFKHNYLTSLQILASFIPVVGWAVAAGIGFGNAYVYYQEGDTKQAGLEAIFAVIPGLGIAGKLGLSKIAPKFMAGLGKKVALNQTKNLTKQEIRILDLIGKNQKAFKSELDNYFKTGIMKNAKQITKEKLKAAGKKYGIGLAKTSTALASYMTIAQLYGSIYDANVELINDTELLALNTKLDADFERWLTTKYKGPISDGIVSNSNSKVLTEADWLTSLIYGGAKTAAEHPYILGGIGAVGYYYRNQIAKLLVKVKPVNWFTTWNKMQRDKNTFKALGWNPGKIKEFYKSGAALEEAKKQWALVEEEVAAGRLSPREAMGKLTYLEKPGVANKVFNGLTKSYNKATTVSGQAKEDLTIFLKDLPKPANPGAGFGKQAAWEAEMKIWREKSKLVDRLLAVQNDPEYSAWLTKHLQNQTATKNLKWVNNTRIAKYAAFWTLVGGAAGLKTYFFINAWKERVKKRAYKRQLDSAEKNPVYFKAAVGTKIPLYTWIAQTKTWKYDLNYTIESNAKILKVKESADKTHTLIQFPGKKYYWVLTNTLSDTPVVKKKTDDKKETEPVKKTDDKKETEPVTPEVAPVAPEEFKLPD